MAKTKGRSSTLNKSGPSPAPENYWSLSARPLHSLIMLLPLIAMYEVGAIFFLTDFRTGVQSTISARKLLMQFFEVFGVFGLMLPGLAMLVVLLVQHIISRDAWRVRGWVLVGMVLESVMWALPLIVFAAIIQKAAAMNAAVSLDTLLTPLAGATNDPNALVNTMSPQARMTIAIGAGLYEELLFRLVAIAGLHFVVKDLLQGTENAARIIAICGSALAFALYHPLYNPLDPTHTLQLTRLIFFFGAGVFFACIYLFRGFALVVYTHAVYDIIVLVVLPGMARGW